MRRSASLLSGVAVAWLLLAGPRPAAAVPVPELHRVEVLVEGRDPALREEAIRAALAQVLVRVAGRSAVLGTEAARAALADASRLLVRYAYRDRGPGDEATVLALRFDEAAVAEVVRAAGLPVWGEERPLTLVWVAAETADGARRLVVADDEAGLAQALALAGQRRGLPLVVPLGDLADRAAVDVADLWAGFDAPVMEASRRYGADRIAVVRLGAAGGGWRASWRLLGEGGTAWEAFGASPAQALGAGIDGLAERLAELYAPIGAGDAVQTLHLRVEGVQTLADIVRVERYLAGLPAAAGAMLVALEGERAEFRLRHEGGLAALRRGLEVADLFAEVRATDQGIAVRLRR
ncbi:DUF2066 domain-containing protein [Inmirania thermothiophila]|uniref:DUF2066 domain-containing protein n=1 Tax=Inmirania thermothiophila TaxID=1750597 RepID=A0A3N1Y948_9GAMM|nr:DUF2066 domain-containing protein [Inmirania thermothiophila]ROR35071.1 hypothetical protein EDC57_0988 [Inmirania thermothiophila]